jgi:hypothetical protein
MFGALYLNISLGEFFVSNVSDNVKKYNMAIFKPKSSKFWIFWPIS